MYRFVYCLWLWLLLLFIPISVSCQSSNRWEGIGVESNIWWSKMIRHSAKFTGPISNSTYAIEINFLQQTNGKKDWQIRRNYPLIGIGFLYLNYNNKDVYGDVIGIYPNITIPILNIDKWEWNVRLGMGLGYATRPYERFPNPNPINVAIGGHLNNVTPFTTDIRYRYNQHIDVQAGFQLAHVSNAAYRSPNLGINIWGLHVGVKYFPVTSTPHKIEKVVDPLKSRWLFQLRTAIAFDQENPVGGPTYKNYIVSAFMSKRYWSKNKAIIGLDASYYTSTYSFQKTIEENPNEEWKHAFNTSVYAGNEFLIGKLGVLLQLGVYTNKKYNQKEWGYEKLGGNYYFYQAEKGILKEAYASILLKAQAFTAQFAEIGLGVSF